MITLIHGDDIEKSREEFTRLKKAATAPEVLDGRTIDETSLTQALESGSLLGGEKTVFIENLFGRLGRKQKLIESLCRIIQQSSSDVVLWENKLIGATVIKNLGRADFRLFKISSNIFQFLDSFSLAAYERLTDPPELIHTMLARRIRVLIEILDGVTPEGMQGWQLSRLTHQAKLFTMDKLIAMYKRLLDMEYSIKNGTSPFTLKELTEQFLISL